MRICLFLRHELKTEKNASVSSVLRYVCWSTYKNSSHNTFYHFKNILWENNAESGFCHVIN